MPTTSACTSSTSLARASALAASLLASAFAPSTSAFSLPTSICNPCLSVTSSTLAACKSTTSPVRLRSPLMDMLSWAASSSCASAISSLSFKPCSFTSKLAKAASASANLARHVSSLGLQFESKLMLFLHRLLFFTFQLHVLLKQGLAIFSSLHHHSLRVPCSCLCIAEPLFQFCVGHCSTFCTPLNASVPRSVSQFIDIFLSEIS